MNPVTLMRWKVAFVCSFAVCALLTQGASLTAGDPILLENTKGKFDFIRLDATKHRLLLAHTGNQSLDVFDLAARRLLKSVPTGAARDCAVDLKHGLYYASVSAPPKMVIVDADKMEVTGEVVLPAAADLITYNPINSLAFVQPFTISQP